MKGSELIKGTTNGLSFLLSKLCHHKSMQLRLVLVVLAFSGALAAADFKLKATPETLAWGYYWAGARPVLTVQSGDVVDIQTVSGNPSTLEAAGLPANQIQPELRRIYSDVPKEAKGPGGHLLTGPIAIAGAPLGDVLEVRIREIRLDVPYAYNSMGRNGFLADVLSEGRHEDPAFRSIRKSMIGHFAHGDRYPSAPFFGQHGTRST